MASYIGGRPAIPPAIRAGRLIAIGRGLASTSVVSVGAALIEGGIRAFEITIGNSAELAGIRALTARFADGQLLIGAGTVLDIAAAEAAVAAGAQFLVMPHTDVELVEWAATRGIAAFPGALSPTEILAAWRAGAAAVKLFPASAVGPYFVRDFRGPFPDIPLVPTGGVTLESAPSFIAAGAVAVGLGSWLTGSGDPELVTERSRLLVGMLGAAADEPSGGRG